MKKRNNKTRTVVIFGTFAATRLLLQTLIEKHGREVTFGQVALPRAYPKRLTTGN